MGIDFEKYPFMRTPQIVFAKQHYEVTDESIKAIQDYFGKHHEGEYTYVGSQPYRRQMSTPGAYLKAAGEGKGIDVVADVMTSVKFLDKNNRIDENMIRKFKLVYHTIGNFIPIPEGANYGGSSGSDNYMSKLNWVRERFELISQQHSITGKKEDILVKERIDNKLRLSSRKQITTEKEYPALTDKLIYRYWLQWEAGFTNWEDYIEKNLLQDFVKNREVIDFDSQNPDMKALIELIIKRGYRICNEGKEIHPECLSEIYDGL
ncbi:MAG: hypothetical protein K5770_20885 [Lachnospiraceae bacterium]|nr:hypothetical protein [Lachnospiraceae bacterium]